MLEAYDIAKNIERLQFQYQDISEQKSTPFYREFSGLFNSEPIFFKCNSNDRQIFIDSIKSLPMSSSLTIPLSWHSKILKRLITNDSLNKVPSAMAELNENLNSKDLEDVSFESISPFTFDGLLAEMIHNGGLFVKSLKSDSEIVNYARQFSDSIIQNRFSDFMIYETIDTWSQYFGRMGYDRTFVLFDTGLGEFWILSKTDHD